MPHRPLGGVGFNVSLLSLGTVKLGRNEQVKYPSRFALPTDREARALLDEARALNINLLDTAPAYGRSEARLGELLTERDDFLICTKAGETFVDGRSSYDFSPAAIVDSVQSSLARLRRNTLDIVLLHSDGDDLRVLDHWGALDVLADLKRKGWIRAIGISHKTVDGGLRAIELGADVLMTTYNETDTSQLPVIERAAQAQRGVLIKKALASGHSAGFESALKSAAAIPGVSSLVVGTLSPAHLRANAAALEAAD